jgi:hypothetical protein
MAAFMWQHSLSTTMHLCRWEQPINFLQVAGLDFLVIFWPAAVRKDQAVEMPLARNETTHARGHLVDPLSNESAVHGTGALDW